MKAIISSLLFIVIGAQVAFAQIDYDKKHYQLKVIKFNKMKRTGTVLGVAGAVATVGGIALISSADWYTETNAYGQQNTTTDDPNGVIGLVGVIVGVPMLAGGVVLAVIGSKKERQYQEKLNKLSAGYFQRHGAHGITLRLRL